MSTDDRISHLTHSAILQHNDLLIREAATVLDLVKSGLGESMPDFNLCDHQYLIVIAAVLATSSAIADMRRGGDNV